MVSDARTAQDVIADLVHSHWNVDPGDGIAWTATQYGEEAVAALLAWATTDEQTTRVAGAVNPHPEKMVGDDVVSVDPWCYPEDVRAIVTALLRSQE